MRLLLATFVLCITGISRVILDLTPDEVRKAFFIVTSVFDDRESNVTFVLGVNNGKTDDGTAIVAMRKALFAPNPQLWMLSPQGRIISLVCHDKDKVLSPVLPIHKETTGKFLAPYNSSTGPLVLFKNNDDCKYQRFKYIKATGNFFNPMLKKYLIMPNWGQNDKKTCAAMLSCDPSHVFSPMSQFRLQPFTNDLFLIINSRGWALMVNRDDPKKVHLAEVGDNPNNLYRLDGLWYQKPEDTVIYSVATGEVLKVSDGDTSDATKGGEYSYDAPVLLGSASDNSQQTPFIWEPNHFGPPCLPIISPDLLSCSEPLYASNSPLISPDRKMWKKVYLQNVNSIELWESTVNAFKEEVNKSHDKDVCTTLKEVANAVTPVSSSCTSVSSEDLKTIVNKLENIINENGGDPTSGVSPSSPSDGIPITVNGNPFFTDNSQKVNLIPNEAFLGGCERTY